MGRWLAVGALVATLALSGCDGTIDGPVGTAESRSGSGSAAPSGVVPSTGTPSTAAGIDYVALGDSFSAGPLIPVQRLDPLGCGRSTNNYPAYLAGYLDVASYRDVTCSGAKSRDVTGAQTVGGLVVPPQADALSASTDLVTVGLGGNDRGLFGRLVSTCLRVAATDRSGQPCRRAFTSGGVDRAERSARRLEADVERALRTVRTDAPAARVLAVGYPQLLPASGPCAAAPFARRDVRWVRHVESLLNRSVARAARAAGATYVDLWAPSTGRDACAGDRAWVRGVQDVPGAAILHPFRSGEHAFARIVYRVVTDRDAPDDGDANAAPPPGAVVENGTVRSR